MPCGIDPHLVSRVPTLARLTAVRANRAADRCDDISARFGKNVVLRDGDGEEGGWLGVWGWRCGREGGRGREGEGNGEADHEKAELLRMKSDEFKKWKVHSEDVRGKIGLAQKGRPWTSTLMVSAPAALPRCSDNLDVCFWKLRCDHPGVPLQTLTRNAWCHISQSVQRLPYKQGKLPCLLANSTFYSYEKNVCLSGAAHMEIIGWDRDDIPPVDVVSDNEARDLAGNAFSLPCSALVSSACISNPFGPWWQ